MLSAERNVTELGLAPRYWMSVGAQPSAPVARLLGQAGVMPTPPPPHSQQTGPKKADKGKK
ncbi:TPA: 37S ribosomal protein S16, mitochondrial [Trebouxia sp. C0004]